MDGFQRLRFAQDPARLAAWESASNVVADRRPAAGDTPADGVTPQGGTPGGDSPGGGSLSTDVRPAA